MEHADPRPEQPPAPSGIADHASHAPPAVPGPDPVEPPRRRRPVRNALIAAGVAVALVLGGGAAWAADRFLVPKVQIADVASYEAANSTASSSADGTAAEGDGTGAEGFGTVSGSSYIDGETSVEISTVTTGSGADTVTYYVAEVTLGDATELRSAFANNQFGQNIIATTSETAEANGAVFAINGDYYGFRDTGIVIRNGVVYRDEPARTGLALYADGTARIYDETETSAEELVAAGVWNTLSFGPALVENGEAVAGIDEVEVDTNFGNHSIQGEQPRTAIGVIDENHLVFVVVDGRETGYSRGATLTELAEIMLSLGAETAYNLDGGGSSTMFFDGEVVNQPSNGGERGTSDILYVAG